LAHAFLQRYGTREMKLVWLKPDPGHVGSHIFIETTQWIFDYHGYSRPELFHAHTTTAPHSFGPAGAPAKWRCHARF
jgi:hypothetical protein